MARPKEKLSSKAPERAKPGINEKTGESIAVRLGDGGGLYLHVTKTGGKSWVFVWTHTTQTSNGKKRQKREMGLGPFPALSLADARSKAEECRKFLADNKDPMIERDRWRKETPTFKECVDRYYADKVKYRVFADGKTSGLKSAKSRQQFRMTMDRYAKPLHGLKVSEITIEDVLGVLRPIWDTKKETASRTQGRIERVLSYATAYGWRQGPNPAQWVKNLDNILSKKPTKKEKKNHAALPYSEMPGFMAELRGRDALTARFVEFTILTAARSKQARTAQFADIDMKSGLWTVPASSMKGDIEHTVPLCSRALEIVQERLEAPECKGLVFPYYPRRKILSENAGRALLHRMGYSITLHGFRATFKTWATAKTDAQREIVELAMAHTIGDEAEMAYLRETAHDKRLALMNAWQYFCDGKAGNGSLKMEDFTPDETKPQKIVRLHG